jgi:hypothetical protein
MCGVTMLNSSMNKTPTSDQASMLLSGFWGLSSNANPQCGVEGAFSNEHSSYARGSADDGGCHGMLAPSKIFEALDDA